MLNGIQNFLRFINNNWTSIVVIISLVVAIIKKIQAFLSKSDEQKIAIAKAQIKEIALKLITEAEFDFEEWNKAGSIKRAQVIESIYNMYPILGKVTNQQALIDWLDDVINTSLSELHTIIELNQDSPEQAND